MSLHKGIDTRGIKRVWVWMKPKTFASLVQKYGRCVRSFDELGEAILLVTKELYKKYEALFAAREEVDAEDPVENEEVRDELQERRGHDVSPATSTLFQDRRTQKFVGAVKARDNQYLLNFIVTKQCRRIIWNEFFDNARKRRQFLFFCPMMLSLSTRRETHHAHIARCAML